MHWFSPPSIFPTRAKRAKLRSFLPRSPKAVSAVLLSVVPIFVLILLGWILAKARILKAGADAVLGELVFKIALPVLIFRTFAHANLGEASAVKLWAAYFIGVIVTWTAGTFIARRFFKRDAKVGVIAGLSGAFANNVFIGLPLVDSFVGPDGLVALSLLIAVHLPLMMMAGLILMERAAAKVDGTASQGVVAVGRLVVRNLVRSPLVIAVVVGLLFNLLGLSLPRIASAVIDPIAQVAGPLALLSIGMTLEKYSLRGELSLAAMSTSFKLLLLPAVVLAASWALALPRDWAMALVLNASIPTGVNAWLVAERFKAGQSLAASTITLTTLLGVVTVSLWAWGLQ